MTTSDAITVVQSIGKLEVVEIGVASSERTLHPPPALQPQVHRRGHQCHRGADHSKGAILPVVAGRGADGLKKFMPKNPLRNEMGMNGVVMRVRVFITSFILLLITER